MGDSFRAIVIEDVEGKQKAALKDLTLADLPDHDVLVDIAYSTLNYKDGLAVSGKRIARSVPMVGGIDLAGTVAESRSADWKPGDKVIVNGYGLSERHWGGYAQRQRLKPEWLVPLPAAFDMRQAMAIGTAGYTAMLAVMALEDAGLTPEAAGDREVLVTGAAGGVGSVAIAVLSKLGYKVAAATGRPETHDYLGGLGATSFVAREELAEDAKPLEGERWAGAVDSVGSRTLAKVLAQTAYGGAVAACGLAGGADLPTTVMPFILRGVKLLGIDSVMAPQALRRRAWERLGKDLSTEKLAAIGSETAPLTAVPELAGKILKGQVRGRVVIDVNAS
ncbi:MDR family oxidoreductase [Marinibaculum pumilum]|uniref:MDR family oxidoreductase n=1 Tax=Marinibaculum pumilum TaxID=1766165 RepID=A0ABV7L0C1_9PROT